MQQRNITFKYTVDFLFQINTVLLNSKNPEKKYNGSPKKYFFQH